MGSHSDSCPCDSDRLFAECCRPIIEGQSSAGTAEALMRSRYTAYVIHDSDYLLESWHVNYRPKAVMMNINQKWQGLKVKHCVQGTNEDKEGLVEFVARYKIDGKAHRLHEISRFTKIDGAWKYVDGELKSS